jgi:hypothetical protein
MNRGPAQSAIRAKMAQDDSLDRGYFRKALGYSQPKIPDNFPQPQGEKGGGRLWVFSEPKR